MSTFLSGGVSLPVVVEEPTLNMPIIEGLNECLNHLSLTESHLRSFGQVDQRLDRLEERMGRGFTDIRQDLRTLNTTVQRQMWALIAVVVGAAIKVLFFP